MGESGLSVASRWRGALVFVALLAVVVACGGDAFEADGGRGGTASGGSGVGGSGTGGADSGGADPGGGSGGGADAGGSDAGGSGTGGGPGCEFADCPIPDCGPGTTLVTLPGECCASCQACTEQACPEALCAPGDLPVTQPGECCPTCQPGPDCSVVFCAAVACGPGQIEVTKPGECCPTCVDDPKLCELSTDCVVANRPRSCCGCPEAINRAALTDDACWYLLADGPTSVPDRCQPQVQCGAVCAPCPAVTEAYCEPNTGRCELK